MNDLSKKYRGHGAPILLVSLLIISACAIFYELLISTVSTYLLGSSILHFSITIGLFLSSMGLGAFLSKYITRHLLRKFIVIEFILGIVGGFSTVILYTSNIFSSLYYLYLVLLITTLGTLIGTEIPLLTRILKQYDEIKEVIARVLAFDYLGALVASLLFPLVMLPLLGIMRTAFLVGLINVLVASFNLYVFRKELATPLWLKGLALFTPVLLFGGLLSSYQLVSFYDQLQYGDKVLLAEQTPYQRIVLTHWNNDFRLHLNGNLQFSSVDEYRYHEPLVHVPAGLTPNRSRVLVLGGGDGMVVKELLKYDDIELIDLVDIDPRITELALENHFFLTLNDSALHSKRVAIHNEDAFNFVKAGNERYNLIVIDLPDPGSYEVSKMYTKEFYGMCRKLLSLDGVLVTQSTSPFFARHPFWCIHQTLEAEFPHVTAYNSYVPSFGLWGFNLATNIDLCRDVSTDIADSPECIVNRLNEHIRKEPLKLRYLAGSQFEKLFYFEPDVSETTTCINTLDDHCLVKYYESSWNTFNY